ncbi:MAG: aromatic amino acid lyase, partial [Phycisphaerae bacterium]|nr:aromatic amino acid lyase [Phycisphaerae bacterium]
MEQEVLILDGGPLSGPQVTGIARKKGTVEIGPVAIELMQSAREVVRNVATSGKATYSINTGFGALSTTRIDQEKLEELQMNLLRSHAAGVGEPLEEEIVRGMMVLLAASLCRGMSGARPEVAQCIAEMLNKGVTPVIPSRGSVGASGDLAPLAHLALVLCGEG